MSLSTRMNYAIKVTIRKLPGWIIRKNTDNRLATDTTILVKRKWHQLIREEVNNRCPAMLEIAQEMAGISPNQSGHIIITKYYY